MLVFHGCLCLDRPQVSTDGSVAVAFGEKWPVVVYDVIAGTCLHKLFMMGEVDLSYEYAITPDNRFLVQNIMRVPEEQQIENNITYPVIFDLQRGKKHTAACKLVAISLVCASKKIEPDQGSPFIQEEREFGNICQINRFECIDQNQLII